MFSEHSQELPDATVVKIEGREGDACGQQGARETVTVPQRRIPRCGWARSTIEDALTAVQDDDDEMEADRRRVALERADVRHGNVGHGVGVPVRGPAVVRSAGSGWRAGGAGVGRSSLVGAGGLGGGRRRGEGEDCGAPAEVESPVRARESEAA